MNNDDCARLVNLIVSTWPTGPKGYVWTQALAHLDNGPANRAYLDLRDTLERVTIPAFLARYDHASGAQRRRADPDPSCEHCGGCGFEAGPPEYETVLGEPHEYSTLVPCRCTQPATRPARPVAPTLDL